MPTPILATKLYIPPPRPNSVARQRLVERLNEGLRAGCKLTLISAPAGFGKTTLVSEWVNQKADGRRLKAEAAETLQPSSFSLLPAKVAWLSLDEGDNDPARFLTYVVAAVQTIVPEVGAGMLRLLQSPQPPPPETLLTSLLNKLAAVRQPLVLVLDDYHAIEAEPVDQALAFLLQRQPPHMHLVIATREDPGLPLARLRARGEVTELRAADLRFTPAEAAEFLNRVMGLDLAPEAVAALDHRTEGWIAGLQLAALSMQGHQDVAGFIHSFTGSHRFVLDYLVEEVLQQQPAPVQTFLLRTSILDRMCGPLCEAVLQGEAVPFGSGQATLEYLERANLFSVPLDSERRWYRYHHLFGDLLRQRLQQSDAGTQPGLNALHVRASQWYEDNGLNVEAFRHAAAANDIDRAERLMDGRGIPLHLSGAVMAIVNWLETLPPRVKDARPTLWWRHGAMLLVAGIRTGVEEKLNAAEAAMPAGEPDDQTRLLMGRIAAARATLALTRYQADTMLAESRRALAYLPPGSRSLRANAYWTLGFGHFVRGERPAARQAYCEAIAISEALGDTFTTILATIGLGNVQEADLQLREAAETYQRVVALAGDQPQQIVHEAHLGLARLAYEWNDLETAERHGHRALDLARQYDRVIDRFVICEVFLARVRLARGDADGAAAALAQTEQTAHEKQFTLRLPEVAAAQVLALLRQGRLAAAAEKAQAYDLPLSRARVHLARGNATAALAALEPWRQQAEAMGWNDQRLRTLVLQALALQAQGEQGQAVQRLAAALALAEPAGCVRTLVDEGAPMRALVAKLRAAPEAARLKDYVESVLAALAEQPAADTRAALVEPLSQRELEVLQLIAQGLSNQAISERLVLALDTVKGHNRRIYDKLGVQRRTEAVARARELGLL